MSNDVVALKNAFDQAGQGQVFRHWEALDAAGRQALLEQVREIDLAEMARLTQTLLGGEAGGPDLIDLEPAPYEPRPEHGGDAARWAEAKAAGETALQAGRVAAFTVAGGQGTRLGFDGPKGTFPVTPVRGEPLFAVFAGKLLAAAAYYGRSIPWFIMTSHQNHEATEAFFVEHDYFGLGGEGVMFFRQGRMPAVDFAGKILLEAPDRIAMSPDGHGGSLRALARSGALDRMVAAGIDTISYFQVDNPLVRAIDPAFIGWHLLARSEMSSKMVPKAYAEEKLGHFCRQRGQVVVIEYSDLPMVLQREVDPVSGALRYIAGSIAIHILDREFVRRMAEGTGGVALPFHRADKKIPCLDFAGAVVRPDRPNGVKFEMFVFDALPFAARPLVIETRRTDDFSPVKNAEGLDSPQTCRDDQVRQFARWANAQGARVPVDATGLPPFVFEVSPAFGYDEDSFARSWAATDPRPVIRAGTVL
jgi:UDP-N-acetylglucosamine/UDP-N-acetylgalactosamine diphosphorylase